MRIFGKVFGFIIGFMLGRLVGGLLGLWLGHVYDRSQGGGSLFANAANRQRLFFNTTFAVMGHVAKASGQVTQNDIRVATALMDQMQLQGEARKEAQAAFREGKADDFDIKDKLKTFRMIAMGRRELVQMFLEIQIQTALSDAKLEDSEHAVLLVIAQELGCSRAQLDALLSRWQAEFKFHQNGGSTNKTTIEGAYSILGLSQNASNQDVKRAYRKLMNEHHPDKLVAKGLPPEMMELAKNKAQDIQTAYDKVKSERGMR